VEVSRRSAAGELVEQLVDDRLDAGTQAFHAPGRQRRCQQLAHPVEVSELAFRIGDGPAEQAGLGKAHGVARVGVRAGQPWVGQQIAHPLVA
jgi:hypothetical protein